MQFFFCRIRFTLSQMGQNSDEFNRPCEAVLYLKAANNNTDYTV